MKFRDLPTVIASRQMSLLFDSNRLEGLQALERGIGKHEFEVTLADGRQCQPVADTVSPTHLPIDLQVL